MAVAAVDSSKNCFHPACLILLAQHVGVRSTISGYNRGSCELLAELNEHDHLTHDDTHAHIYDGYCFARQVYIFLIIPLCFFRTILCVCPSAIPFC